MASASGSGLVYTPSNTPFHGSATVEVTDTMPPVAVPAPMAQPWWMDPWKLGVAALGGALLLTLLMPRRD